VRVSVKETKCQGEGGQTERGRVREREKETEREGRGGREARTERDTEKNTSM
jgi:hypothetical protein